MPSALDRDALLVIGAAGRTGQYLLRYLAAAAVPTLAAVRRNRPPAERQPGIEYVEADLQQPSSYAPLLARATQVIWVAGSDRRSLSPGAWQVEVDGLAACLEIARRDGFAGRWLIVSSSCGDQRGTNWAETRWRELKRAAEDALEASEVNYFMLRTGRVTAAVGGQPRVTLSQHPSPQPAAELPCNVLAFLLTGAAMVGTSARARVTARLDYAGQSLQEAVYTFSTLRSDARADAPLRGRTATLR